MSTGTINTMMKRCICFLLAYLIFTYAAIADSATRITEEQKEEATNDSWMTLESDTEELLMDGWDYHLWTTWSGTSDAITWEITGYEIVMNDTQVAVFDNFFMDCIIPYDTWRPLVKNGKILFEIHYHTVYGDYEAKMPLYYVEDVKPLCEEHQWEIHSVTECYSPCPSDVSKHYHSSTVYDRECKVCGLIQKHAVEKHNISESVPEYHSYNEYGYCSANECRWNLEKTGKFFEDSPVDPELVAKLKERANGSVTTAYTDLAQNNENNLFYQVLSEGLRIITDPPGGIYDLGADFVADVQQGEALERVVVEMLYGREYGDTTYSELAQLVDAGGNIVTDFDFSIAGQLMEAEAGQLTNAVDEMAKSIEYAGGCVTEPSKEFVFDLNKFTLKEADELCKRFDEYLQNHSAAEGTDLDLEWQKVKKDLKDVRDLMEKKEAADDTSVQINNITIGVNALLTCLNIAMNHISAASQVDETLQSENEQLHAIMSEKLQKVQILSNLMESLDPSTPLYKACRQVKSDIENDLEGLNSTDQRIALRNDGKVVTKFACGTIVSVAAKGTLRSTVAAPVLFVTGVANVGSDVLTEGGTTDAKNSADVIENLVFVHNALNSMDTKNMTYYESELYYMLAKKELDYASALNNINHSKSWITSNDEEEKLNNDYYIVSAQRALLDTQNEIREAFYKEKQLPYEPVNNFDPEAISRYMDAKYDFTTGSETIPAYANMNLIGGSNGNIAELNAFGWALKPDTKYEILKILENDAGERFLEVVDTKGKTEYIKEADLPNAREILENKYSLYIDVREKQITVYTYPDNGLTSEIAGKVLQQEPHLSSNGDYAKGYYDIIRAVCDEGEYYYKVRDTHGTEYYIRADDAQYFLQEKDASN